PATTKTVNGQKNDTGCWHPNGHLQPHLPRQSHHPPSNTTSSELARPSMHRHLTPVKVRPQSDTARRSPTPHPAVQPVPPTLQRERQTGRAFRHSQQPTHLRDAPREPTNHLQARTCETLARLPHPALNLAPQHAQTPLETSTTSPRRPNIGTCTSP